MEPAKIIGLDDLKAALANANAAMANGTRITITLTDDGVSVFGKAGNMEETKVISFTELLHVRDGVFPIRTAVDKIAYNLA